MNKAKNLQLSLTQNWFEMTKSGVKTEDYREITPYWANRLLTCWGDKETKKYWKFKIDFHGADFKLNRLVEANPFKHNVMTLGYPKSTDTSRILKLEHKGIEIRTGNPDWGAVPGVIYFVIKHGRIDL